MKKLIAMMMALVMLFALCACGQQPTGGSPAAPAADSGAAKDQGQAAAPAAEKETKKEETRYWTFATPPTTSALYSFCVGLGQAIQADMPEYQITISECTGAVQITKLVRQGNAMIGNSVSSTDYENYMGIGDFDGNPGTESRMLWYYENTPLQLVVSEASGINTLSDLQGKKFNPGGTTTSAESLTFKIMETLGIEPDFFIAGQADAGDAYSSRQIDGIGTHAASVCLHPSYLEQYGEPKAVGLVVTDSNGKEVTGDSTSEIKGIESKTKFWEDSKIMDAKQNGEPMIERRQGLQDRSKTIWGLVNPNDYELVIQ